MAEKLRYESMTDAESDQLIMDAILRAMQQAGGFMLRQDLETAVRGIYLNVEGGDIRWPVISLGASGQLKVDDQGNFRLPVNQ